MSRPARSTRGAPDDRHGRVRRSWRRDHLYPNMKRRQMEPKILVGDPRDPRAPGGPRLFRRLDDRRGDDALRGHRSPRVARDFPALATAADCVFASAPEYGYYRAMCAWTPVATTTISPTNGAGDRLLHEKDGDICLGRARSSRCWACPSSDTAPVLWALRARGAGGRRRRRAHGADRALYRDDGTTTSPSDRRRIVTDISCRRPRVGRSVYLKLRRRGSFDFPVLGVCG